MTSRIGTHKPLQLLAFLSILAITGPAAYGQADIATYQGADRSQKLLEGAKKEGTLTIYSSATVEDMTALTTAFTKKYGVKTQVWRASSENIIQRAATEARGNRFDVDVFETDGVAMEAIYREKLLQEVRSPLLADLMPQAIRPHKRMDRRSRADFHRRLQHPRDQEGRPAEELRGPHQSRSGRASSASRPPTTTGSPPSSASWARRRA